MLPRERIRIIRDIKFDQGYKCKKGGRVKGNKDKQRKFNFSLTRVTARDGVM